MQAVVLVGGEGTRLRPLTYAVPKPMAPLLGRPFIGWIIERLRAAADQLGRGTTRDRATLLERCFALPGAWWFGPVEILTDDLPPEWLGVMLGFAFDRRGLLSVRDGKLLRQVAAAVFDQWQGTRYPHRELAPDIARRVVRRLGGVRRLLQPASLFAYLAQLARRRRG